MVKNFEIPKNNKIPVKTKKKISAPKVIKDDLYNDWGIEAMELIRGMKPLPNPLFIAAKYKFISVDELEASIIDNEKLDREWKLYKAQYKADLFDLALEMKQKDIILNMVENEMNLLSSEGNVPDIRFIIGKDAWK